MVNYHDKLHGQRSTLATAINGKPKEIATRQQFSTEGIADILE